MFMFMFKQIASWDTYKSAQVKYEDIIIILDPRLIVVINIL